MIRENVEPVKHYMFVYMAERGLKNTHNIYSSYRSLLRVDMYAFYINLLKPTGYVMHQQV